jgi:predicted DNA-binding antitoxin AbrB/MazE fold protein
MSKTIRARFMGGQVELLEKSEIPEGAELTVTFEEKPKEEIEPRKGKWARVAEEISSQGNLTGKSEEINRIVREFRDNFSF